jgi:hypothetical protein
MILMENSRVIISIVIIFSVILGLGILNHLYRKPSPDESGTESNLLYLFMVFLIGITLYFNPSPIGYLLVCFFVFVIFI